MAVMEDKRTPGRWFAKYYDAGGTRRSPGFPSQDLAELHFMENAGPKSKHELCEMHFPALLLLFEKVQRTRLIKEGRVDSRGEVERASWNRVMGDIGWMRKHVAPAWKDIPIGQLDSVHFDDLRDSLPSDYSASTVKGKMRRPTYVLRIASARRWIDINPGLEGKPRRARTRSSGPRDRAGAAPAITEKALEKTRAVSRSQELVWIDLMAEAGATPSEANGVADDDVDLRRRRVQFSHLRDLDGRRPIIDPVARRSVKMSGRLAASIVREMAVRRLSDDPQRPLLDRRMDNKKLAVLQERAGIRAATGIRAAADTAMTFRHRAAVRYIYDEKIGLMALAARLGYRLHSSVDRLYGKYLRNRRNSSHIVMIDRKLKLLMAQRERMATMDSTTASPPSR